MVKVGSLEREILEVLWTQGPLPVREVLERLNASARRNRAYNTVMSTAARMETKGLLERTKQGRHLSTPRWPPTRGTSTSRRRLPSSRRCPA